MRFTGVCERGPVTASRWDRIAAVPVVEQERSKRALVGGKLMIITGSQNISDHSGDIFLLLGRSASLGLSDNAHSFIVAAGDQQCSATIWMRIGDRNNLMMCGMIGADKD
jgi:hypothetical protein